MSQRPPAEPPRLAPRKGPFGALVAAACTDAGAAEGLAAAYASMDREGRRRLVEAVVQDARQEGACVAVALAALLGVEEEPAIARTIFEAMESAGGEGLACTAGSRALLAGGPEAGTAVLVRSLYGAFVELFALAWNATGVTRATIEPFVESDHVEHRIADLPDAASLAPVPFARAVERVTTVLWEHLRRHGELPRGVEGFADVL